ncbi:DNA translocase FtsK [Halomonas eurihalina]|uniref:DNA translocase FtsK n=1 Tax=Halomonas eurihalina TaxID=42566 RepID=A0A5D9DBP7_HALER|nr:DNA translocase FtsK 4TM domain-containing protein [Halomonas eurihalina]MDR5859315.1 DNA translocase FtsK 4TM domain-containing protein [Halomonas eurihalina]TZG40642.1 DNA translocase FtsK [Halomonas eurihalina]
MTANKKSASHSRAANAKERAKRFGLRLQGSTREGVVILLLAACVFLLLALFSFNAGDPGWSRSGPETEVANWMGAFGAWLADVLYSLFGASALWWPAMLGFAAWWLIRSRQVDFEWDATLLAVRCGGLVLLLLGTTTLGALHFYRPDSPLPYAAGGILGEGLVGALLPMLGSGGTSLLALASMLCGVPLFTGLSWLTIMDELGQRAVVVWRWASNRFSVTPFVQKHGESDAENASSEPSRPRSRRSSSSDNDEVTAKEAETESETESGPLRGAWWRRLVPGFDSGESPVLEGAGRRDPGFGDDGKTEIPWEVPDRTPSAKRPEAAYTAQASEGPKEPTISLSSSKAEATPPPATERAPSESPAPRASAFVAPSPSEPSVGASSMSAREEDDSSVTETADAPANEASSPREPQVQAPPMSAREDDASANEPADAPVSEVSSPREPQAPRREPETVPEPILPDDDQIPSSLRRVPDASSAERKSSHDDTASRPVETPRDPVPSKPAAPAEPAGESDEAAVEVPGAGEATTSPSPSPSKPEQTRSPMTADEAEESETPGIATADQAREAADDAGLTLWTVEHLQSQRPSFEEFSEPDGELPSLRLLTPPEPHQPNYTDEQLADMAELLETRLREYGVKAEVVDTWPGPVITRFEIKPAAGVKVSKISNLAKDLARSLMVKSVRVVEVIPGRPTVGIEIPNPNRAMIRLREVIDSDRYQHEASALTVALGQDIGGAAVVANLGKMPHLLVAGTTGSGKSVGVNAMLISMLLKAQPDEVRMIMVDPKMLELSVYDGIPHLLAPVVTDMKEAANALRWCVAEMERRYKLMAAMGVRNIAGFNDKLDEAERAGAQVADPLWEPQPWEMHQAPPVLEKLPYIVVVIDEFADMFMIVGKKVEELIARLAQKARAAGIHLILATQRPSVDVVTGLIKANIPTRMAFQVSSRVDSRTILDQGGAENLLGHGDMLYLPAGAGMPSRVHGAFVDDDEVHRVVEDWKRRGEPEYIEEILSGGVSADALAGLEAEGSGDGDDAEQDALYDEAVQFVTESRRASISAVQRRFKIGYNRAARLVESMEGAGVVSSMGTNGAREVLAPPPVGD